MRNTLLAVMVALMSLTFVACEKKGPAETAGEKLDDAATDLGNKIEDTCEDIKKEAGADDTDC